MKQAKPKYSEKRDTLSFQKSWEFDAQVTHCYDDMLKRSVPDYAMMRRAVAAMAKRYLRPNSLVIDLGCSNGALISEMIQEIATPIRYIGVDNSPHMLAAAKERLAQTEDLSQADLRNMDLRLEYPPEIADVVIISLTLQFIPVEYRQQLLTRAAEHTKPGGIIIVVDKIAGATPEIDCAMTEIYYDLKISNGYTQEQVTQKKAALQGIQTPLTAEMNELMLKNAGFANTERIWQWMNFAAWAAIRPKLRIPVTRAVRGAIARQINSADAILADTRLLLTEIMRVNQLDPQNIVSIFFTMTEDLTAVFPAKAARQLGWNHAALMCAREIPVAGALSGCVRVLIQIREYDDIPLKPVYLCGAEVLLENDDKENYNQV